jgi:hypothetical protein
MNTSTGAPSTICRASEFDAPKFATTVWPVRASNSAASCCKGIVRLEAAETVSGRCDAPSGLSHAARLIEKNQATSALAITVRVNLV